MSITPDQIAALRNISRTHLTPNQREALAAVLAECPEPNKYVDGALYRITRSANGIVRYGTWDETEERFVVASRADTGVATNWIPAGAVTKATLVETEDDPPATFDSTTDALVKRADVVWALDYLDRRAINPLRAAPAVRLRAALGDHSTDPAPETMVAPRRGVVRAVWQAKEDAIKAQDWQRARIFRDAEEALLYPDRKFDPPTHGVTITLPRDSFGPDSPLSLRDAARFIEGVRWVKTARRLNILADALQRAL